MIHTLCAQPRLELFHPIAKTSRTILQFIASTLMLIQHAHSASNIIEVIARTGDNGIESISETVSINDNGDVAFVGQTMNGHHAFVFRNGKIEQTFDPAINPVVNKHIRINNPGHLLVSRGPWVVYSPAIVHNLMFLLPPWTVAPANALGFEFLQIIRSQESKDWLDVARGGSYVENFQVSQRFEFGHITWDHCFDDNGRVAFISTMELGLSGPLVFELVTPKAGGGYNRRLIQGDEQPMMSNNGLIVVRDVGIISGQAGVAVLDLNLNPKTVLGTRFTGIESIGRAPSISSDGKLVATFGSVNALGAIIQKVEVGPGILAMRIEDNGYNLLTIANKSTSVQGNLIVDFDPKDPVAIEKLADDVSSYVVGFLATDSNHRRSAYRAVVDSNSKVVKKIDRLVQVGESIKGLGTVTHIQMYDSLNNRGQLAFWIKTDSAREAVIRSTTLGSRPPDLRPRFTTSNSSKPILPGAEVDLDIVVLNDGNTNASGSLRIDINLTTGPTQDDSYQLIDSFTTAINLAGGSIVRMQRRCKLDAGDKFPLDRAGSRRIQVVVNSDRSVVESSYTNNTANSDCFFLGEVINVVTHGFNLQPPSLAFGGEDWQTFWLPFHELAQDLQQLPSRGSMLDGNITSHVIEWHSDVGFWKAFMNLFIGEMSQAYANKFKDDRVKEVLLSECSKLLKAAALQEVPKSRGEALTAAFVASQGNLSRKLLPNPDLSRRFQRINLIGHSRGAAVNAMLSRFLNDRGYLVSEFVALDGFGVDWPNSAGTIGDFNIEADAEAVKFTNYRVEQDLSEMLLSRIGADGNPFGKYFWDVLVSGLIPELLRLTKNPAAEAFGDLLRNAAPSQEVREYLLGLDLRAPIRWGAGNSPLLLGPIFPGRKERSNHLNITQYFADHIAIWASSTFVGRHRNDDRCAVCPEDEFTVSGSPKGISRMGKHDVSESFDDSLYDTFRDATFEECGKLMTRAANLPTSPSGDPVVDAWLQIALSSKMLLQAIWHSQGDSQIGNIGTNSFAILTQTTNTVIIQLIRLKPGVKRLEFDIRALEARGNDAIQLLVEDIVVGEFPLSISDDFRHQSIPLDSFSGWKSVGFRLSGSTDSPSKVWIDNVFIHYEVPIRLEVNLRPGQVVLSWPVNGTAVELQSAQTVSDLLRWQPVTNAPIPLDGFYRVTLPISEQTLFFKLQFPK